MAPQPTYAQPHVQLGRLLIDARRRGVPFEEFWRQAVREDDTLVMTNRRNPPEGCVRWPTDRNDRRGWQKAILGTKETWRSAYEGLEPTRGERAVAVLGDSIGALARVADERAEAELADAMSPHAAVASAA